MAFEPIANVVRSTVEIVVGTQPSSFTLWFQMASPATSGDLFTLNFDIKDWFENNVNSMREYMSSTNQTDPSGLTGITSYAMDAIDAPMSSLVEDPPIYGAANFNSLPVGVRMVVTFTTGGRGRSARGRAYLPGLNETTCDNSLFASGLIAPIRTWFEDLNAAVAGANGATHVLVSRQIDGQERDTPQVTPITGYVPRPYVGSQRRSNPSA